MNPATQAGLGLLDGLVDRQAAMMAYLDDFRFILALTVVSMPLLLLIRKAKPVLRQPGEAEPDGARGLRRRSHVGQGRRAGLSPSRQGSPLTTAAGARADNHVRDACKRRPRSPP